MNQDHKSEDEEIGPVSEEELVGTDHTPVSQDGGGEQNPDPATSMPATQLKYAGFIRRAVARIIDVLIVSLITFILFFTIGGSEVVVGSIGQIKGMLSSSGKSTGIEIPIVLFIFVATIVFLIASFTIGELVLGLIYKTFFVGKFEATPGKMVMGLKIVRPDASRVGHLCAFGRYCTEYLALVPIVICLALKTKYFPGIYDLPALVYLAGYLMVAIDRKEHRALHDRLCNTRVVRKQGVAPKNGQRADCGKETTLVSVVALLAVALSVLWLTAYGKLRSELRSAKSGRPVQSRSWVGSVDHNPRATPEPLWQGKVPTIPVEQFTNASAPTDGLVAWYPFNGNVQDESGNERHATNHGARFVPDRFGVSEGALRFDGKEFVSCGPNRVFELGEQGSLGCWMLPFAKTGPLIGKDPVGYDYDVQIGINPHDRARGKIALAMSPKKGELIQLATGPEITPGKWYHVLGQWDANGFRLFVDGKQVAKKTGGYRVHAPGRPLLIGCFQSNEYFKGIIDDVAVYNRALNTHEVESLYRSSELAEWQSDLSNRGLEKVNQPPIPTPPALNGRTTKDADGTHEVESPYRSSELTEWQSDLSNRGLEKVNQLPIAIQLALKGRATKDAEGNISMRFTGSKIDDLTGLTALPLTELDLDHTGIRNLKPLGGLKLRVLKLYNTRVTDLRPLSDMPLNVLFINSPVADLGPLRGMPLTNVAVVSSAVVDIRPLAGMKLNKLWIASDRLVSIASLKGQPIVNLELGCPSISDLSPLLECRQLKRLTIHRNLTKPAAILRRHPSLTHLVY